MAFEDKVAEATEFFKNNPKINLICHADADGICASAILQHACQEMKIKYNVSFVSQISSPAINAFARKTDGPVVFVDCGSSHLKHIENALKDRDVLILDHHQAGEVPQHIQIVNPFLEGLDGTREICTAGIAWLIADELLDDATALLPIALIGAQADNQEPGGFEGFNKEFLEKATDARLITTRQGARLFGKNTRKLLKLIQKSYDLKIPGLSTRYDAKKLLEDIGISPHKNEKERFYNDLTEQEKQRLDEELIKRSRHPEPVILHYTIVEMPEGPLKDTREAATVLNACGRLGKPTLGVLMILGNKEAREASRDIQQEYGEAIHKAHEWYRKSKKTSLVREEDDFIILQPGKEIPADLAGTLCSVLTRGREVSPSTVVICLAHNQDGTLTTKVSSRALRSSHDLAKIMSGAAEAVNGEGGGHSVAAGAVIPTDKEAEFLKQVFIFSKENN